MAEDFDGEIIVPDSWEPLIGFRLFHVTPMDPYLHSTGISQALYWEPGVNTASCQAGGGFVDINGDPEPKHVAPDPECRCGFYAMKTAEALMEHFGVESWVGGGGPEVVWAKVAMWGTVVEGSRGMRGQYAKVVELLALPTNIAVCMPVAELYEIDVSLELLTMFAWFVGGPAHGRVIAANRVGTGTVYEFPIMESALALPDKEALVGQRPKPTVLNLGRAVYQRDPRTMLWRFRGYRRN